VIIGHVYPQGIASDCPRSAEIYPTVGHDYSGERKGEEQKAGFMRREEQKPERSSRQSTAGARHNNPSFSLTLTERVTARSE